MGAENEEIRAMKSGVPRWLKAAAAWAGAIGAVLALLSQIGPPIHHWLVGNDIAELKKDVSSCKADVKSLEQIAAAAIDASEDRFVENEKHAIQLRGGLENLRNEVRVRHGVNDVPPPTPVFDVGIGTGQGFGSGAGRAPASAPEPAPRPASRREVVRVFSEETDERLRSARVEAPRQEESLMDKIKKKAPSAGMLEGALD